MQNKAIKEVGESMTDLILTISINVNKLNNLIKRKRLSDVLKRHGPIICYLHWTYFKFKDKLD